MDTSGEMLALRAEIDALTKRTDRRALWRSRWAAIGAAVAVSLGGGAAIRVASAAPGDVKPGVFYPVSPTRILDTRPAPENVGGFVGPLTAGQTHTFQVTGVAGVPETATSVVMNMTVDVTTGSSFLTVWPYGEARPTASNLNWKPGVTIPNLVTVKLGAGGKISAYNLTGTTHVIADVAGYYVPGDGKFMSIAPTGAHSDNPLQEGGGASGGLAFFDGASNSVAYSLTLPPDYTPGGQIEATFTWHIAQTGCSVGWAPNFVSVSRAGMQHITGASVSTGMTMPAAIVAPDIPNQVKATTITLTSPDSAVTLRPGDSYTFGFFRSVDGCTVSAYVDSMAVRYD